MKICLQPTLNQLVEPNVKNPNSWSQIGLIGTPVLTPTLTPCALTAPRESNSQATFKSQSTADYFQAFKKQAKENAKKVSVTLTTDALTRMYCGPKPTPMVIYLSLPLSTLGG